ncbi:MAG: hypothetical protein R2793_05560 [Flavobacteriaceae bacterium]
MKKVTALVLTLFAVVLSVNAASEQTNKFYGNYNGQSYIFVEGGVEFSVFPDGQFDFVYVGPTQGSNVNVSINTPGVSISYNSGYNYDAYVQYDDYGAVIQVEDVPIYYDEFGRIIQAGSVEIQYNSSRRIVRVGGLHVYYNHYGYFSYCTGYISPWYTTYIYRPWHVYYARPYYAHCVVYDYPYRRYYTPIRYTYAYHRNHYRGYKNYTNGRREFAHVGSRTYTKDGRYTVNKDFNPNRRNTAVAYNDRKSTIRGTNTAINRNDRKVEKSVGARSSNSRDAYKGKPVTTNTRPMVANNTSKGKPSTTVKRTSVERNSSKGNSSKGNSSVNRGNTVNTKPKATQTRPSVSKSTNSKTRPTTTSSRKTSSSSRGSVQKRGRG